MKPIVIVLLSIFLLSCDNQNTVKEEKFISHQEVSELSNEQLFRLHRKEIAKNRYDEYYSKELGSRGKEAVYYSLNAMPKEITIRDYFGFNEILSSAYGLADYNFCEDNIFIDRYKIYISSAINPQENAGDRLDHIDKLCLENGVVEIQI